MSKIVNTLRKFLVLLVGLPLLGLGILFIPLPGPGVLISLAALFILSLEFDIAKAPLHRAKTTVKKIYDASKAKSDRISKKLD